MKIWLLIVVIATITLLERAAFIALLSQWQMPGWLVRALKFVPVAVFPALIVPLILKTNGAWDIALTNPKLIAVAIAFAFSWRTRNLAGTLAVGMSSLWLVQWLLN